MDKFEWYPIEIKQVHIKYFYFCVFFYILTKYFAHDQSNTGLILIGVGYGLPIKPIEVCSLLC